MTLRSFGTGRTHTGEGDMAIVASGYQGGGPLVVVCHGAGGSHATYSPPAMRRDLDLLARSGCVVVVADLGGTNTWGNDSFLARVASARTYAQTVWDADLTRMALIGDSMGAMAALNYHWRNPTLVRCSALRIPVVAADALHDRTPAGLGALIDIAYGGAWEANVATRDPSAAGPAALIAGFAADVRVWYSTDDTTVLPADITAFTAATGVRAIPLGAIGHSDPALAAAVQAQTQAAWIWSRLNTQEI